MNSSFLVAGLGEVLWDELPGKRLLGGAPANFAWHAAQLGCRAEIVSSVGRDDAGRELFEELRRLGLGTFALVVSPNHPTGRVTIRLDETGQPQYHIHEPAAWDDYPFSPAGLDVARRVDALSFGTLSQRGAATRSALRAMVAASRPEALRVFDVNLRQRFYDADALHWGLGVAGGLKLNHEELPTVAEILSLPGDEEGFAAGALARAGGLRWIALTRAEKGATLWVADPGGRAKRFDAPGPQVTVVDTVGAGDALAGALTVGWLRGVPPAALLALSVAAAAWVCTQAGATPVWPSALRRRFDAATSDVAATNLN